MKNSHTAHSQTQSKTATLIEEINLKAGEIVEITKDMIIGDVVLAYPKTITVFKKIGIHCVGCYASTFESIEEGVRRHSLNADKVCQKLNEKIKQPHVRRNSASTKSRNK